MNIERERLLTILESLEDGVERDARMKEAIIDAYKTLPADERKSVLRNFVLLDFSNFDVLLEYSPELFREAFPIQ